MRKAVIALAGIAVLGMTAPLMLAAAEHAGPRIEIAEEQYDFGKVAQGTEAVHVFEIRNAGDEPLVIERVQTS